jgi:HSP20 family protein
MARTSPFALAGFPLTAGELFRVSPFSLMRRMMDEMDRVASGPVSGADGEAVALWAPPIEIARNNGDYKIRAELPGLKPDEVKVEVAGDALVLEGERKYEREERKPGVYRTERRYGHFFRSIPLPEDADVEHASARFEDGVLQITMPVSQDAQHRRQIPVQGASSSASSRASSSEASPSQQRTDSTQKTEKHENKG